MAGVDEFVVVGADQGQVDDVGGAVVFPPGDVVGVAAVVGGVAAGVFAVSAGAGDEGQQHGCGGESLAAAEVEGLAAVVGDGEDEVRFAHELVECGLADGSAAEDLGAPPVSLVLGDVGAFEQGGEGGDGDEQRPRLPSP